ncbi:MAG: hypothetical protein Q8J88_00880 [Bacteroidales bacterium]|nr:hypothetical protein [Bacteroidales bacterium]
MKIGSDLEIKGGLKVGAVPVFPNAPHLLNIDANGNISKQVNSVSGPTVYQINYIHSLTPARINVQTLTTIDGVAVGIELGSYTCKLDFEFGNLTNSNYRLAAKRTIEFAFIIYPFGGVNIHSLPTLYLTSHAGSVVKLINAFTWEVKANDITFDALLVSNRLYIDVKSNFNTAAFSEANGSFQARYTTEIKKFNYQSGGGDLQM